jgi:dehydrogenase/reductase SDR family protein 7B
MMDFTGKTIWITGASSGIGAELALQLAAYKTRLIISARNLQLLQQVAEQCRDLGAHVEIAQLDITDNQQLTNVANRILANHEQIDLLIHSAGVSQRSHAIETDISVCRQIMELNFFGLIDLNQRVVQRMSQQQVGHIVVISSVAGKIGTPMRSSYSASKHALHGYFDSLRAELHQHKINVTLVCPGFIQTSITLNSLTADGSKYNKIDEELKSGVPVEQCAEQIITAIANNKAELIISGLKEKVAIWIKRLLPKLLFKLVREVAALK